MGFISIFSSIYSLFFVIGNGVSFTSVSPLHFNVYTISFSYVFTISLNLILYFNILSASLVTVNVLSTLFPGSISNTFTSFVSSNTNAIFFDFNIVSVLFSSFIFPR